MPCGVRAGAPLGARKFSHTAGTAVPGWAAARASLDARCTMVRSSVACTMLIRNLGQPSQGDDMRPTTKVLLTACTTFALAHGVALADPPSSNPPPDPNANPTPPLPPDRNATPATPPIDNNPPVTPDSTTPAPVEPAPIATPATPPPVTTPVVIDTTSDTDYDARYSYAWSDDLMRSRIGVSAIIGGGVVGFTDRTMRNTTS